MLLQLYTSIGSPLYYSSPGNSSREIGSDFRSSADHEVLAGQYPGGYTGGYIGGYTGWNAATNHHQTYYNYLGGGIMMAGNHTEEMQIPQAYNLHSVNNSSSDEEEATTLCATLASGDPKIDMEDQEISVDMSDDVTNTEDFVCRWNDCDSTFDSADRLAQHVTSQHAAATGSGSGGGQYRCCWQGCPRAQRGFNARYKMLVHIRTHTKEKPHKCSVCGKRFSRTENLKIHARSHSGERPYVCPVQGCNKAYSNSSDRFKHTRTHLTERPYACRVPGCQKRYTDPSSLRKHVKTFKHHQLQETDQRDRLQFNDKTELQTHQLKPTQDQLDQREIEDESRYNFKLHRVNEDKLLVQPLEEPRVEECLQPKSRLHRETETQDKPLVPKQLHFNLQAHQPKAQPQQPSPVDVNNHQKLIGNQQSLVLESDVQSIETAKLNKHVSASKQPISDAIDINHRINNHNYGYDNHEKSPSRSNDIEMTKINHRNLVNNHVDQANHQKQPTSHLVNNVNQLINQENLLLNSLVTNKTSADCKCSRHDCLENLQKAREFFKIGAFLNNFAAAAAVAAGAAGCNRNKSLLFDTGDSCDVTKSWSKLWTNQNLLITPEFLKNNYSEAITDNEAVMMDIDVPLDLTMHNK